METEISVILINYNSTDYTKQCIGSVLRETKNNSFEIIVIDNNSRIENYVELEEFCSNYKKVTLFRSKINLGFSAGNMLGCQFASGNFLYFLNNDCILKNDNLKILYNFMKSCPEAAICSGQMFNGKNDFHSSFGFFPDLKFKIFGRKLLYRFNPKKYPDRNIHYKFPVEVPFVTGAAMFIDRRKFAEIGGFDTNFFLYCEEEDIALRFRKINYKAFLVPEAEFIHFGAGSTNQNYELLKEFYISFWYFLKKHYKFSERSILKLLYFLKNIKKFYKNIEYLKISLFILKNPGSEKSLKHKQKLS